MIYFIGKNWNNPVKIGVAKNPQKRLYSIQTGNHMELKLLAVFNGNARQEKIIHKSMSESNIRGEWFNGWDSLMMFQVIKWSGGINVDTEKRYKRHRLIMEQDRPDLVSCSNGEMTFKRTSIFEL